MTQLKHRIRLPLPQPAVVHVRRSYAECRFGQIHLWTAYPSGGGFDEHTPLLCLHHGGGSGRMFAPMLPELGDDRGVYAPDLPGHGSSDPAGRRTSVVDFACAVGDFIDSWRLRTVDVFGYQLGASIATELAIARPQQMRRVMLWGVPFYARQDRVVLQKSAVSAMREDGSDVIELWQHTLESRGPGVRSSAMAEDFGDRLRAGVSGMRALAAAIDYPSDERLPLVRQRTVVLRLRDEFWDQAPRASAALANGRMLEVPDHGQGFLSAAPDRFAAMAREFFDT